MVDKVNESKRHLMVVAWVLFVLQSVLFVTHKAYQWKDFSYICCYPFKTSTCGVLELFRSVCESRINTNFGYTLQVKQTASQSIGN